MPEPKNILLIMPHMIGGGAERVAALLMNAFARDGCKTEIVLTADRQSDVVRRDLEAATALTLLPEQLPPETKRERFRCGVLLKIYAQVSCNLFELFRLPVPAAFAKASLTVQYHREIAWLRERLLREPDCTVIAFLQPAIPIAVLAAQGLPNRLIISERCDPNRLMKKRYGRKFIEKYYPRADAAVFQTDFARAVYPKRIADKGVVIPNPLKADLPAPYTGKRRSRIVTFCRISRQKNLRLLIRAFGLFLKTHPGFSLAVYGDAVSEDGKAELADAKALVSDSGLEQAVDFLPFRADVHGEILRDAMYVNSSDFEGLSNAMLEALAVGLPCVCTDCPAGGARAVLRDGENGLLVPMNDPKALCAAMCRIADDPALAEKLSRNGAKLRGDYSAEAIAARWEALL